MKIAVLTTTTSNREWLYSMTNPTKEKYCKKFGYDYKFELDFIADPNMFLGWNKIAFVNKYLAKYDYVVWMDDDAGFIRFDYSLEDYIKKYMKDKSFAMAKDFNDFNSGVFIIKNDKFGRFMFKKLWENRELYKGTKISKHYGYMDQPAISDFCDLFPQKIYIADGSFINSYDERLLKSNVNQRNEKSLILHISGGDYMKHDLKEIILTLFK